MKKRIITLFLLLIIAISITAPTFAAIERCNYFYVSDNANVLSISTLEYVCNKNDKLQRKLSTSDAEITIVSVESLDGMNIEEYALQLMDDLGVGHSGRSGGMLLLFSTTEKEAYLAAGNRINRYFTEKVANEYLDKYFHKNFEKGNYDGAVKKLTNKLVKWYKKNYNDIVHPDMREHKDNILLYIAFAFFFVGITLYFVIQDKKRRDVYDPSYVTDLYNGNLGRHGRSHHRHHHRHRSYSSHSSRSKPSGRGGGGRSGGGGGGRR